MNFGKIEYICKGENGNGASVKVLRLTFIGQGDEEVLARFGVAALRQRRVVRLTREADEQGCRLSYEDLCNLLFVSISTLKRDIGFLKRHGIEITLKKKRDSSCPDTDVSGMNGELYERKSHE